jgi:hypothetical protein
LRSFEPNRRFCNAFEHGFFEVENVTVDRGTRQNMLGPLKDEIPSEMREARDGCDGTAIPLPI